MPARKLLLYGLQRSGTNFLEAKLRSRFRVRLLNRNLHRHLPEQKHFRLYDEKDVIPEPQFENDLHFSNFREFEAALPAERVPDDYIIISKDPYAWFLSYRRWAHGHRWPEVAHHYIREYNLFYGKWLDFASQSERIHLVRYHDLLRDTEETLQELVRKIPLEQRGRMVVPRLPRKLRNALAGFSDSRKNYYEQGRYLQDLSPAERMEINARLDEAVLRGLGYSKVEGQAGFR